jgi:hypothetical protein
MHALADPYRDAYALALAWLDGDDERIADVLSPYALDGQNVGLLFGVLALVGIDDAAPPSRFFGHGRGAPKRSHGVDQPGPPSGGRR